MLSIISFASLNKIYSTRLFTLHYPGDMNYEYASHIGKKCDEIVNTLGNMLHTKLEQRFSIYLADTDKDYNSLKKNSIRGSIGEARYINGIYSILVKATPKAVGEEERLVDTFIHEITHLFQFQLQLKNGIVYPLWIDEGMAMYMEDRIGYPKPDRDNLGYLILTNLKVIDPLYIQHYPSKNISLFYAESKDLMTYVMREIGEKEFLRFFSSVKADIPFYTQFEKRFGVSMETLFNKWKATLVLTILSYIFRNMGIYAILGILAILLFVVRSTLRARVKHYEDDEEIKRLEKKYGKRFWERKK